MTKMLCTLARGKVILALEGGYNLDSISKSAFSCVEVLLGMAEPAPISTDNIQESAKETFEKVKDIQRKYWPILTNEEDTAIGLSKLNISIGDALEGLEDEIINSKKI
jgi:histone deacetylase 6